MTIFDVSEHLENAYLSDVCFCSMDGVGEVLVVAEAQYSVLLVVDYDQDLQLRSFFPSPRPGPSAICCDSAGVLWVGCEGGEVFMCLSGSGDKDEADLDEVGDDVVIFLWWLNVTETGEENLRDEPAFTILRVVAPRQNLKNKIVVSPCSRVLTPGRPFYIYLLPH